MASIFTPNTPSESASSAAHNLKYISCKQLMRESTNPDKTIKWTPVQTYLWLEAENGERVCLAVALLNCDDEDTLTITFKINEDTGQAGRII